MPREMGAWEVCYWSHKDDMLAWVLQRNRTDKRILLDWLAGYRLGESNSGYIHDGEAGNPVTVQPTGQDFSVIPNMALKA